MATETENYLDLSFQQYSNVPLGFREKLSLLDNFNAPHSRRRSGIRTRAPVLAVQDPFSGRMHNLGGGMLLGLILRVRNILYRGSDDANSKGEVDLFGPWNVFHPL